MDWNKVLQDARAEHPDPMSDPRRTKKGRGWKRETPQRIPPTIERVMGSIYTSHTLQSKATAPERVMNRAMQYHAVEAGRRRAKHQARVKNPNRYDLILFIITVLFCCAAFWFLPQIALWLK